jgi:hypothetical protein
LRVPPVVDRVGERLGVGQARVVRRLGVPDAPGADPVVKLERIEVDLAGQVQRGR